jgi:hypothetical protein
MVSKRFLALILLISAGAFGSNGPTDDSATYHLPWHRLDVNVGGFLSGLNSELRLGSEQLSIGLNISLEDALGLESSSLIARADVEYRLGGSRRHRVGASLISFRRQASRVLESDIDIGDTTFSVGTKLSSTLNVEIIKAYYGYSFFQDDRFDLATSFSVFVMPLKFAASADNAGAEGTDFVAPLPAFGLHSCFAFTDRLFLKQGIEIFYIKVGQFSARLTELRTMLDYDAWERFGFGAGFSSFKLNVESVGEDYPTIDFTGNIGFDYTGLYVFAKYYLK